MTDYGHLTHTKYVLASAVANIAAPTLAEITAATTDVLTLDGLAISHSDTSVDRTPWSGDVVVEAPLRYQVTAQLTAYSHVVGTAEPLWLAVASFRARKFLIVRRGVPGATAFASGNVVEVYEGRLGKRYRHPTTSDIALWTVPLHVSRSNDAAVIP